MLFPLAPKTPALLEHLERGEHRIADGFDREVFGDVLPGLGPGLTFAACRELIIDVDLVVHNTPSVLTCYGQEGTLEVLAVNGIKNRSMADGR